VGVAHCLRVMCIYTNKKRWGGSRQEVRQQENQKWTSKLGGELRGGTSSLKNSCIWGLSVSFRVSQSEKKGKSGKERHVNIPYEALKFSPSGRFLAQWWPSEDGPNKRGPPPGKIQNRKHYRFAFILRQIKNGRESGEGVGGFEQGLTTQGR